MDVVIQVATLPIDSEGALVQSVARVSRDP